MSTLLMWLGLWSMLLWILGVLRGPLLTKSWAKALFRPGLALDALFQIVACLLTATPIEGIHPFKNNQPFVHRGRPGMRYVGPSFAVGFRVLALFVLCHAVLMHHPTFLSSDFALPDLDHEVTELLDSPSFEEFLEGLMALPKTLHLDEPWVLLFLYTLAGALLAQGFRNREFLGAIAVWVGAVLASQVADWLGLRFGWFSKGWFIRWLYGDEFWATFSLLVFLSLGVVGLLVFQRLARNLVRSDRSAPSPA